MNILEWIVEKLGFTDDDDDFDFELGLKEGEESEDIAEIIKNEKLFKRDVNIHSPSDRIRYVKSICEQMSLASEDVEFKKKEYQRITEKLSDLEEIDSLPKENRAEIKKLAMDILEFQESEASYQRPISKISNEKYYEMESLSSEIDEIIKKVEESEKYQTIVRRDMNLLEGEKAALAYQRKEEKSKIANAKAMFTVTLFGGLLAILVLLMLQSAMYINIMLPCMVVALFVAVCLTGIFVSFSNANQALAKVNRQINRAIALQNTAKIKYVNTTNVLDYYYAKYKINSSHELHYNYEKYLEERDARHHNEDSQLKKETLRTSLLTALKRFRINDPTLFCYKPSILVYDEEMASLRHDFVVERQRLRKSIDFLMFNLDNYKNDVKDLIERYPQYSKDILGIVESVE